MEAIMVICIVGIVTWGIYRLFELYARRKERLMIIEKLGTDINFSALKDSMSWPFFQKPQIGMTTLKIALLLIGIGLGLVIAYFIEFVCSTYEGAYVNNGVIYPACITLFGGLGLLIAYFIEQKKQK